MSATLVFLPKGLTFRQDIFLASPSTETWTEAQPSLEAHPLGDQANDWLVMNDDRREQADRHCCGHELHLPWPAPSDCPFLRLSAAVWPGAQANGQS